MSVISRPGAPRLFFRELAANPLFRREMRRLFLRSWRSQLAWLVTLLWLAQLAYLLFSPRKTTGWFNGDLSDDYLYYVFTVFHLYIYLLPPLWPYALLHYRLRPSRQAELLRLTRLSDRERLLGYLLPRYLLALFILLGFYVPLFLRFKWLYEYGGFLPEAQSETWLEHLRHGTIALLPWHPLITLSYFAVTLAFQFMVALYACCRLRGRFSAVVLTILATTLLESALYALGFYWHEFGGGLGLSSNLLDLFLWPMPLYGLLMQYTLLTGPLIYLLKIAMMVWLWRGALRQLRKNEMTVF